MEAGLGPSAQLFDAEKGGGHGRPERGGGGCTRVARMWQVANGKGWIELLRLKTKVFFWLLDRKSLSSRLREKEKNANCKCEMKCRMQKGAPKTVTEVLVELKTVVSRSKANCKWAMGDGYNVTRAKEAKEAKKVKTTKRMKKRRQTTKRQNDKTTENSERTRMNEMGGERGRGTRTRLAADL